MMGSEQWINDRDAVLTMVGLRGMQRPPLYSPNGLVLMGTLLWHDAPTHANPPDALAHLYEGWYGTTAMHPGRGDTQVHVRIWQVTLWGMARDYLLPEMGATHLDIIFTPTRGVDNPLSVSIPRPHYRDPNISYTVTVHVSWPEVLARLVATANALGWTLPTTY